jgi:MFS family permease
MPKWYYGWNIIGVALIFQGVTFGIGLFSTTFFIPHWMAEFDAGRGELLVAVMVSTLAIGIGSPFAGRAMDRLQIRYIVALGGAAFSLGLFLLSMVTAVWQIIAIYAFLIGAGLALAGNVAGQTLAAKWFRGRRGLAVGLVTIGTSTGGFVMPPFSTWLIETYDWRQACVILAFIAVIAIVPITLLVVRNSPEEKGVDPDPETEHSLASAAQFVGKQWTTRTILQDRAFWITVVAFFPASVVFSAIQQNLGPISVDLEITPTKASGLMSTLALMSILGKIGFGTAADHFDNRFLFWIQGSLIVLATTLLMMDPGYPQLAFVCGTLGLAGGGTLPLLGSIVGKRFGATNFGQAMGLLMPFLSISSFGYVVAGWLRDTTGSYDTALMMFLVIMVPAMLGMIFMPKLHRARRQTQPAGE